ncbi:MAG TPA: MBL fold metallo-hydrolase, partial [Candidatus Nanopelagicales bacterium]
MTAIEASVWGHSGLRLERSGERLVLDPGMFTAPEVLADATAVLITHEHPDHVVPETLAPTMAARGLPVWAPTSVIEALAAAGAPRELLRAVDAGEAFTAAGFEVQALGGTHAVIHPKLPPVANLAYLVEGAVLHPGDSFTAPPEGSHVQLLALPVSAPWLKLAEAVDYAAEVAPALAVPIHDAILSDAGKALVDRVGAGLLGPVPYRRLTPGEEF